MKKTLMLFAMLLVTGISMQAQLKKGHLKYSMEFSSDNPQMQQSMETMKGSTVEIYFNEHYTKSIMNMGIVSQAEAIVDIKNKKTLALASSMGMKIAYSMSSDEIKEFAKNQPTYNIELVDEQKDIQGYECKKVILTDPLTNEVVINCWYTEDIIIDTTGQQIMNQQIPGCTMEMEGVFNGIMTSMKIVSIEKTIENEENIFNMSIPEGYKVLTKEEMKAMGLGSKM